MLYHIVFVSAIHQRESALAYMCPLPPEPPFHLPPHPTPGCHSVFIYFKTIFIHLSGCSGSELCPAGPLMWCLDSVALWQVGSPATDQTCVCRIAEWTLSHWATRGESPRCSQTQSNYSWEELWCSAHASQFVTAETSYNWIPS